MRAALPTGTVTFLFTDIEGSTRLLHSLGPEAYGEALAEHRRLLRDAFAAHGGIEIDTQGDAFFVAFPTAPGAAAAARAGTEALAAGPIRVRMGLHTGAPTLAAEGYVGVDVHRGARVAELAHGGQIVVSPATAALLDSEPLADLGLHRLKDFEDATRLHQLGPGTFPPLRTQGSVELPVPATRFLGRERELFDAVSLVLERDPRVLTIVGPGGTGKTRFSIELARLLAEEAEGGTVFVPLAPVREAALIVPAAAQVLGATEPTTEALVAALRDRRTHVVLDNLEHLLPDAAGRLAELARTAPELRLLVTSREALRIQGEHEFDLPPLEQGEAVELFVTRARAVRAGIERSSAVDEICGRLDRLPLAIELAAARTKLLAPDALLERLGQRLDLLKGTRDADERHATLRATIGWSYDLLDADERALFARLSVFAAGCTLESAEAVCVPDLDTLESLLDKSLLRRRTGRLEEERFWMLETIREFAAERLAESPDAAVVRRRHAERMLEIARSAHLTEQDDEPFQLPIVLAERDDMRAALDWAAGDDVELALELLVALENFWNLHGLEEVLTRLDQLLPRADEAPQALRAGALRLRGGALHVLGSFESCDPPYEESLALYRDLGDERGIASLLQRLGNCTFQRGELERARDLLEASQEIAHERFPYIEVANHTLLARIRILTGDVEHGTELLRQSARMAADLQWSFWRAGQLNHLAFLALDRRDFDEAERDSDESLRLVRQDEGRWGTFPPLTLLARVALARAEHRRAGLMWGAVEAEADRAPNRAWERRRAEYAGPLLEEGDQEFLAGVNEGRQLDVWDAAAIALGEDDAAQTVP
jgi:predicted ATPase/class 3 adenylate cyclase